MTVTTEKSIIILLICVACTFPLRALPFLIFGNRPIPKAVEYIGKALPMAVMATLLIYCVRNVSFANLSGWIPSAAGLLVTVGLHIWKKNTFLSIVGGTACYMILVQAVFG